MAQKRKRQLAAIMFTDIVGYSAMMNTNEQEGITKANRYRQVLSELVEQHDGEIIQHYGDGSLSIFSSSVQAVTCAEAIQIALRKQPQVPLRIGIHLGDVVLDGEEIFGDGINIASRVESMGIAGSILMTERISHDLKSHPNLELTSLGQFQFKNIATPLEVFALANKDFPIPEKNNISGKLEPNSLPTSQSNRNFWFLAIGLVVLSTGWMILQHSSKNSTITSSDTRERISIAVLPIENLSETKENKVICNGLMQEIIGRISAVKDFRVLPRTSVIQVANNNLSIPEIAKELGVEYIIEGSLQSSNDQIRINANLIQADDNEIVWNQNFSGDYRQIFDFQAAIARAVSNQLDIRLTSIQNDIVTRQPTENTLAYQEYLKGLDELNKGHLENAKIHFLNAIEEDEKFAEAYTKIAETTLWINANKGNPLDSAIYYADKALSINPNIAAAYLIKGEANSRMGLNIAKYEFLKGYGLNPSSPEVNAALGSYYLRKGQYDKAFRYLQESFLLAPNEASSYLQLIRLYSFCGMEEEAYETLLKGMEKTNEKSFLQRTGWTDLIFKNDPNGLIEYFFEKINEGTSYPIFKLQLGRFYNQREEYEKAKDIFEAYFPIDQPSEIPQEIFRIQYAYTLINLKKHQDSEVYIEDILKRRTKFMQPESSYYKYNYRALAAAHALKGNADSTIYWLQEWKGGGNFNFNLFKTEPIYQSIINKPVVQKFIQKEQVKIDSMAANIRLMRIKG